MHVGCGIAHAQIHRGEPLNAVLSSATAAAFLYFLCCSESQRPNVVKKESSSMFSKPVPKLPEPLCCSTWPTVTQLESPETERVNRESAECRAFRKCFADLADGITDPGWLAVKLYSRELIGPDLRTEAQKQATEDRVKIVKVLSAVEDQIVVSPTTKFREFLDVLQGEPSLQHLATRLEKTQYELVSVPLSAFCPSRTPIYTYASYLKSIYTREKLPMYDKWPHVESKKYINLALIGKHQVTKYERDYFIRATVHGKIDDIKKSKRAMDIGQIAKLPDLSEPKCILLEGAPGVGKSTFAWKLCRKWGKGKLLQQYMLVVLLRLRDRSVRAAKSISDLFQYHHHHIRQAAVDEIKDTGGKGVLLLFEGYDELPDELRTKNSILLDVITGKELPEATVLITSRPWASEFLHRECKRHISQHIEILGFTKTNIQSYLETTTANEPSLLADLKKYISCYPHINSLMCIPLNCAIVVEVYRNSKKDETLVPKTLTELYSSLVRSLLLRHLLDHPVHGKKRKWRVRSFNDLPPEVYQQLCELGRIAFEGILHGQQVIFSDLPDDFETLGLMQCAPELYVDEGAVVSYNFLHLTVQEYLAAFHLSQQPVEKQIEYFRKYKEVKTQVYSYLSNPLWDVHFNMVLRFLCGMRKFNGYPSEVWDTLCIEVEKSGDESANVVHQLIFDMLHWLFEAQDNDVIAKLLRGLSNIWLNTPLAVKPFDCFVLGYCVSHSNCAWRINLGHHVGEEGIEMLIQGAVEEETHCTGGISEMNLSMNNIRSEGVKQLVDFPTHLIDGLESLYLDRNNLNSGACTALAHFIPHIPHLKRLSLSDNPAIGQGGAVPLISSLTAHNSLEQLFLDNTEIDVKDCQALRKLLSLSKSLKELSIDDNDLRPEAIELIISGLHHNTTLKCLNMIDSQFSLQNSISLASGLRTNRTLVELNLSHCNIDSEGVCQIANALHTNNTLQGLYLWGNRMGVKGAAAFAELLLRNKSLRALNLLDDSVGMEGTQKLLAAVAHNTTLETLLLHRKYKSSIASSGVGSRVYFDITSYYYKFRSN